MTNPRNIFKEIKMSCEWCSYDNAHSMGHFTHCNEEAEKYKRASKECFSTIKKGKITKNRKRIIRLCASHYEEMLKLVPDLILADNREVDRYE